MPEPPPEGESCRESPLWQVCVGQAELCCQYAEDAFERRRFEAARGLYLTATSLYQRAVALGGESAAREIRMRLRQLDGFRRRCEAALVIRQGQ